LCCLELHKTEIPQGFAVLCKTFTPLSMKMAEESRQGQIERVLRWINTTVSSNESPTGNSSQTSMRTGDLGNQQQHSSSEITNILWIETNLFRRNEEYSMASIVQKGDIMYR
jgi:hypothetical protein